MAITLTEPSGIQAIYYGPISGSSTTYYYWVQAIFVTGNSALARSAAVTTYGLSKDNRVGVVWNHIPGATGYNVYRTTTTTQPSKDATAIQLATSATTAYDIGSPISTTAITKPSGLRMVRARYDFAVDAGAVSTISPVDASETIPSGAIVMFNNVRVSTACTSGGSATVAVGTSAGSSTTSLLGATAVASLTGNAVIVGVSNGTPFRMSADGVVTFTIGTAALTAGIIEVVAFYFMPTVP